MGQPRPHRVSSMPILCAAAFFAAAAAPASAQDVGLYLGISGGVTIPSDIDSGDAVLGQDLALGDGRVFGVTSDGVIDPTDVISGMVEDGTVVPAGEGVDFETSLNSGLFINGQIGYRHTSGLRGELELAFDTQSFGDVGGRLALGGLDLTNEDILVLFGDTGDRANNGGQGLGVTVGQFFQNARGSLSGFALFANGYYDFLNSSDFTPYVGAGIGVGTTSVDIQPAINAASFTLLDESDSGLVYQVMAGVSYYFSDFTDVYAGVRYRDAGSVNIGSNDPSDTRFPGTEFEFDTDRVLLEVGFRYTF